MRYALFAAIATTVVLAGCGFNVQSPDLFLLTRTGPGTTLTLLVSDGGSIRCNGGAAKTIPNSVLLQARTLASSLDKDAKAKLRLRSGADSVYSFTIKLQNGTIAFPDTAAASHPELAQAELFAVQAAHNQCGLGS